MGTTKAAPGPWRFRRTVDGSALLLETEHRPMPLNDPVVLAVREDWVRHLSSHPQGEANACLIAAAPDLLAACQQAIGAIEECLGVISERDYPSFWEATRPVAVQLRAAIAKAEANA